MPTDTAPNPWQQRLQVTQETFPNEAQNVPKCKIKKPSNFHHGSKVNRTCESLWKHVEDKKFYAVDMCYSHGGREKLAKSRMYKVLLLPLRKLKRGNLPFKPFCYHTWKGVIVLLDLFVSRLGKQFLSLWLMYCN